jgi:peptidoglycan/LPS O-acetylase OafA/YrhL
MSVWYALRRRTNRQFRMERLKRLFIPLLFGIAFIVPPQVYVERISSGMRLRSSPIDFDGGFFEWWPAEAFEPVYPDANLSWHHLWFLAYLFVYSMLLVGLLGWLRDRGESTRLRITGFLSRGVNLLLFPALYLGVAEALLRPSFPNHQDLISDFANHANYPVVFLLGFLIVGDPRVGQVIRRLWWWSLPIGVGVILLPDINERVDFASRGIAEWLVLVGLIGFGRQAFGRSIPWIERFSAISLPFYIWHQTVIVLIAYWVIQWDQPIIAKYTVITSAAFLVTWGLSKAVSLSNPTRALFGMRPRRELTPETRTSDR